MDRNMPPTVSQALEDLLKQPLHGIAATNRRDGTPQLTPIWFDWDGSVMRFSTPGGTAKNVNIRKDNRIAICIDDPGPGRRFATFYGKAELDENPETIADHIRRIRQKYGFQGETTVETVREEGRLLISFQPEKIVASPSLE
jgi:PPOX class probable F420-dependent enzyme